MDIRAILAASPLFQRLTPEALSALTGRVEVKDVSSGETLFREGDAADCLYIVASGRMRAVLGNGAIAGDIGRGEPIGEIGLLAGENRGATVYAVRDSHLLVIKRDDLAELIQQFPQSLLEVTRVIIKRLRQNQHLRKLESTRSSRAYAVVAASPSVDAVAVARELHEAFCQRASSLLLTSEGVDVVLGDGVSQAPFDSGAANESLMDFLHEREGDHQYLIYSATEADAWACRAMRQVDRILVVADSSDAVGGSAMLELLKTSGTRAPVELILLRPEGAPPGDVLGWRSMAKARAHYFLRLGKPSDLQALARQLTGRGVGLVLGGGGARGFAHLGLLRALNELQIPVDVVGGASMGGFFSALTACGHDVAAMTEIARDTFVKRNYLNDYLFPSVALIRGRKFARRLSDIFSDRQIEHLRTPFFCVSTNLTRGAAVVHDRGPLAIWVATSMCVPGVAPPVAYKGELLVDGAVVNSLPTDVMQSWERGPIIASDVSTEGDLRAPGIEGPDPEGLFKWEAVGKRPGLFSIIFRTATLTSESGVAARAQRADAYVRMPVSGIALFDWKRMDEIIERGYKAAMEKLAPLKAELLK